MHFLAFEGLDGSGKSTLIRGVSAELARRKISFIVTREPGGTPFAELVRELILRLPGDVEAPIPKAEALLYAASRAQHVEEAIRPALKRGEWVLCDRFLASTIAFQAGARGIDRAQIDWLNDFAISGLRPALTVLLDLPFEESVRRRENRSGASGLGADRLESENQAFHEAVRKSYLDQARSNGASWITLDAAASPDALSTKLVERLSENGWL